MAERISEARQFSLPGAEEYAPPSLALPPLAQEHTPLSATHGGLFEQPCPTCSVLLRGTAQALNDHCWSCAGPVDATPPPTIPPHATEFDAVIPDPAWLRDKLEVVRRAYGLPALAAAVVLRGRVLAASAVGVRKLGDATVVGRDDCFQIGSIAKPMTATLVALMVDRGLISWDTTMASMFPELLADMQPAYRAVTVEQQLAHVSGMPFEPRTPEHVTDARASDPAGRRYEYTKAALRDTPVCPPGSRHVYSGGPVIVVSYLERLLGVPYEQLMADLVFKPLGMHAGFGSMSAQHRVDGPWEHAEAGGVLASVNPDPKFAHQARSPVGRNVHSSIVGMARFAAMHLDGAKGRSTFLTAVAAACVRCSV
eukprot:TRINITY_DN1492_c0_g1_i1.p1 TRINITY_DN1492_c0_g1~~TRINITY_DN1492_c0_g1_i1.p1  ORF type:complete len:368 (-),score=93.36 TRINITY_DN1492_c0_g1_i1:323-1426(-)